jgi:hypothetical protein
VTTWQDLGAEQNNDVTFPFTLTTSSGAIFNPTGSTLSLVLKASETAADNTGTTFTVGSGLTIVSAALGQVTWKLPHANTATPGTQWYRLDAVDASSNRTTLRVGVLSVQAA